MRSVLRGRSLSFVLLGCAVSAAIVGCSGGRGQSGRIGIPGKGSVRLLARRIKSDDHTVQWVWTVVGDRNWTKATHSGDSYRLSGSYPLNSLNQTGGTHVWEFSMAVKSGAAPESASANLAISLRGSNATLDNGTGSVDLHGQKLQEAVHVEADKDQVVSVGSEVSLASIAGRSIHLKLDD